MNNIKLIVGSDKSEVDSKDISTVSITYALSDITEYGTKSTSFTKSIQILQTPKTDKIFKGLFNINSTDYDYESKYYGQLKENGIPLMTGYIKLVKVTSTTYNIILSTTNINALQDLGDTLITGNAESSNDMVFDTSILSHTPTLNVVRQYMRTTPAFDGSAEVVYPFIDYKGDYDSSVDANNKTINILPAITAKPIFDKILSDQGYTYDMTDSMETVVNKLVIPYNGSYTNLTVDSSYVQYIGIGLSGEEDGESITSAVGVSPDGAVRGFHFNAGETNSLLNFDDDYETISRSISLNSDITFTPNITLRLKTSGEDKNVNVNITIRNKDGVDTTTTLNSGDIDLTSSWKTFSTDNGDFDSTAFTVDAYSSIYVIVEDSEFSCLIDGDLSYMKVYANDYLYSGEKTININDLLPVDYKKADFLNDIFLMFNAYISVDPLDESHLFIQTYDDFYSGGEIKDWTNKIDDDSYSFESLSGLMSKSYTFGYTVDDDSYITNYTDNYSKEYQNKVIYNNNDFVAEETEIKLTCAPTAIVRLNDAISIPRITNGEGTFQSKWAPRLLFYNQIDENTTSVNEFGSDWSDSYTAIGYYPTLSDTLYASGNNEDNESNVVLSFNKDYSFETVSPQTTSGKISNRTLYNLYYKNDIERFLNSKSKLLTIKLNLSNLDISTFSFNDKIYLNSKDFGSGFYRINTINEFKGEEELTEVELIKLNYYDSSFDNSIEPDIVYYTSIDDASTSSSSSSSSSSSTTTVTPTLDKVLAAGNTSTRTIDVSGIYINGVEFSGSTSSLEAILSVGNNANGLSITGLASIDSLAYTVGDTALNFIHLADFTTLTDGQIVRKTATGFESTGYSDYQSLISDSESIKIGQNLTGDRPSSVMFYADDDNAFNSAFIYRYGGENGGFSIANRGTGTFAISSFGYLNLSGTYGINLTSNVYCSTSVDSVAGYKVNGNSLDFGDLASFSALTSGYIPYVYNDTLINSPITFLNGKVNVNDTLNVTEGYQVDGSNLDFIHLDSFNSLSHNYLLYKTSSTVASSYLYIDGSDMVFDSNVLLNTYIQNDGNFVSGFSGYGSKFDFSNSSLEVDDLIVRGSMSIYELVINKIRATNGSLWVSDSMKYEKDYGSSSSYYKLGVQDGDDSRVPFQSGDIIKAQKWTGSSVRSTVLVVYSVSSYYINCLVSSLEGNAPEIGDEFVRIGNTSNTNRQGALYLTASDSNAPYMDVLDGVISSSFTDKVKVRLGKLDGITDSNYGTLSGYGLYAQEAYLTGAIRNTTGSWSLNSDGSGSLAAGNISWTSTGVLTIVGSGGSYNEDDIPQLLGYTDYDNMSSSSTIISGGLIRTTLLDVAAIKADYINTSYIEGLGCDFASGTIGGWNVGSYDLYNLEDSNYVVLSNSYTSGTYNSIARRGLTVYDNIATYGNTRMVQIGALSNKDTLTSWPSTAEYGIKIYVVGQGDVFRADSDGLTMSDYTFGANGFTNGDYASDVTIRIANDYSGSGSWYNGSYLPKGIIFSWNNTNAGGHISMGEIASDYNSVKEDYYGFQMMDKSSNEYFCLATDITTGTVYNKIAGWSFDNTYLWTGTQQSTNNYATDGITIGNGAIRSENFRIDTDGGVYINGDITVDDLKYNITSIELNKDDVYTIDSLTTDTNYFVVKAKFDTSDETTAKVTIKLPSGADIGTSFKFFIKDPYLGTTTYGGYIYFLSSTTTNRLIAWSDSSKIVNYDNCGLYYNITSIDDSGSQSEITATKVSSDTWVLSTNGAACKYLQNYINAPS